MCIVNGERYRSDVIRNIKKFDIYICQLGDYKDDDSSSPLLHKNRPCVIVSSDNFNNGKSNMFHVAPIRTEHTMVVNKDTIEDVVNEKRKVGRLYVPIEMEEDDYRFIDITQTRPISSIDVRIYKGSIINEQLQSRIDESLNDLYLSKPEVKKEEVTDTNKANEGLLKKCIDMIVENDMTIECASKLLGISVDNLKSFIPSDIDIRTNIQYKEISSIEDNSHKKDYPRSKKIPAGFSIYFNKYITGEMSVSDIATRLGKANNTVYTYIHNYRNLQQGIKEKSM